MGEKIFIYYNHDELKQLVTLAGTSDKTEVVKFVKEKSLSVQQIENAKDRRERLRDLELQLKCWKSLKELGYTLEDSIAILQGKKSLPEPHLELLQQNRINKGFCDVCKHPHSETEPSVCKEMNCNCGLR